MANIRILTNKPLLVNPITPPAMKLKLIIRGLYLLLTGFALLITNPSTAQRWRKVLDFAAPSGVVDVVILANGDIISLVNTNSMYIIAMDQKGEEKWRKNIGEGIGLVLERIDDDLLVGGKVSSSTLDEAILIKLTLDGSEVWRKKYERGFISAVTKKGSGYLLGGNIDRPGSSSNSVLYKVDSSGIVQWMNQYDVYSNSGVTAILDVDTDLYLVISASTVGVGFEGTVLIKANASDGQVIWQRDKALGYYDNFPDESDLLRPLEVSFDAANEIVIAAPVNSSNGLIYSYSPDGELTTEVKVGPSLPHALQIMQNGDYLIAGILAETLDGTNAVVERRTPAGAVVWQRTIGQGSFFAIGMYGDTIIAAGTDQNFRSQSTYQPYIVKMTTDGRVFDSGIHFEIAEDLNKNCMTDLTDQPLQDILLKIDDRFFSSGPEGTVMIDVDTGLYEYALDLPPYLQSCIAQQSVSVQSPDEIVTHSILVKQEQCADLSVGITYTEFIRGETGRFYVQYNNYGSVQAQDVVLNITLDDRLQLEAVSSDFVTTADGIQITIPFLPPNVSDRIQVDVRIDEELVLFSTICVEASITPRTSCNPDVLLWNGPDLEMDAVCENNIVVFSVKNKGTDMTEEVPYSLFADGFKFEEGTIQLQADQERIFHIASGGSTISMRSRQVPGHPFNAVLAGSIEACGLESEQIGSQGMVRMFEEASPSPWISRACIEVRDQYSSDRVFEIPRGLGRYHLIDSTQSRCEFSLVYLNDSEIPVENLELFLRPGWQFDILTFSEVASSHPIKHEALGTGIIKLKGEHMSIKPGEQLQYRFALDLFPSGAVEDFLSVGTGGVVNDSIPVTLFEGFYNSSASNVASQISPLVSIDDGSVTGRGHTWEFDQALHVQENGTVIHAGSTYEFGVDSRALVQARSYDNTVLWQHAFAFKEGGSLLRKIIPAGAGRLLLIGSIDDNQVPDNYINDAYAGMLMIDANGQELWRRVWKPGNGTYVGGSLNNGHFYREDKILLLGFRYTSEGPRQFILETDISGDIHWIRDFTIGTDNWGDPVYLINDVPMKVSAAGNVFIVASDGYDSHIVKLDEEANILEKSKYIYNTSNESIYQTDFVILEKEELVLTGYGYSYDAEFNFTVFGSLIRLDAEFNLMDETKILDQYDYIELTAAVYRDNVIFASGAIQVDSTSGVDAVIIRTGLAGEDAEILRIADFGARDYAQSVALGPDGRVFAGVQTQTIDNFYNLQMGYFWTTDTVTETKHLPHNNNTDVLIFPNPARDVIHIVSKNNILQAKAFDMNGTQMLLTPYTDLAYRVDEFPAGLYLMVVHTADDKWHIIKFVKVE